MKEAVGYVTNDGTFFESSEEAEEWESWELLRRALIEVGSVDTEIFTKVVAAIPNEIRRYINANEAAARYREIQASLSTEDQTGREVNNEAILEQSISLDEPLPNMGSGVLEEKIRLERAINGVGSGRVDASDVRSGENMATGAHTEPTKTRNIHRTSNIRKGKME